MLEDRDLKIWIDLDNTPHVPFFLPLIRELERLGNKVIISARNAYQVCELADKNKLNYERIGRHYGRRRVMKLYGLLWRAAQLLPFCLRHRPDLALSHGSRSQALISNLLCIPSIIIFDYEHAKNIPFAHARWLIAPEALSEVHHLSNINRIRFYRGIKEDVYVPDFKPEYSLRDEFGLKPDEIIVAVRPPSEEAHYRNQASDILLHELMLRIFQASNVRAILLPRNKQQELAFRSSHPEWFIDDKVIVPSRVVDGLRVLWFSDLVVSGGGTMIREAAALGIPAYSIFMGKPGAVDTALAKEGRLLFIKSTGDIWMKINFVMRDKTQLVPIRMKSALGEITKYIQEIMYLERL